MIYSHGGAQTKRKNLHQKNTVKLLAKITFEKVVKSNHNKVFDVISNFENFEKLLPKYYPSIVIKSPSLTAAFKSSVKVAPVSCITSVDGQ